MSPNSSRRNSPRRLQRALGIAAGVSLALGFALAAAPASAAPGDEHLAGLEYVALGDSYAAGFGLTPLTGLPVPGCAQSSANYPHQVALELGLALTDVTCSGAATINLTTTAQPTIDGTAPIQNDSLSETTDIVTVTIGGNDIGFADIATFCAALMATGPVFGDFSTFPPTLPNCREAFVQPAPVGDTLAAKIADVVAPALDAVLADIALKAPNAKVFVVGYSALTPDASQVPDGPDGCFTPLLVNTAPPYPVDTYPYTLVDVPYLHSIESLFDQAVSAAAAAHGATMISLFEATSAHSPCATTDPYLNGVTVDTLNLSPLSAILVPGALHPNAAGAAFQAEQVEAAIRAAFPAPDDSDIQPALAATGTDSAGWLIVIGAVLLLVGGLVFGLRFAARRRSRD